MSDSVYKVIELVPLHLLQERVPIRGRKRLAMLLRPPARVSRSCAWPRFASWT